MSLAATHPEIAAEWHPTRNNGRLPTEFTFGQQFVAVWQCPKSQTHIYPTRISTRTSMLSGCPDCARLANKGGKARSRSKPVAASVSPVSGAPAGGMTPGDAPPEVASALTPNAAASR